MDNDNLNTNILAFIHDKNTSDIAKNSYTQTNIMNFLHEVEFGTPGNFASAIQHISYPEKQHLKINAEDLLFILNNFDLKKTGTFEVNYNKNIYEYIYLHLDDFKSDNDNYTKIKEKLRHSDIPYEKYYYTDFFEIASKSDLMDIEQFKETYLKTQPADKMVKSHIIKGENSDLFTKEELQSMIDKYYNESYEVNPIDKKKQFNSFSLKGNRIINLVKSIDGISAVLECKIEDIQSLPASNTLKINQHEKTENTEYFIPKKEFEKNVDDDILFYLLTKTEECLKNASDLTRDKSLNTSVVSSLIKNLREKFTPAHNTEKNKMK